MRILNKSENNRYRFALLFRQFMLINNKHKFSSIEIKDIGTQLNRILNNPYKYSTQHILGILSDYGIKDILQKHSHAFRSRLWFHKPLCSKTLKVHINV